MDARAPAPPPFAVFRRLRVLSPNANARHFDHHVRPREEDADEGENDPRPTRTSPIFAIRLGLSPSARARDVDVSFETRLDLGQRRARTTETAL